LKRGIRAAVRSAAPVPESAFAFLLALTWNGSEVDSASYTGVQVGQSSAQKHAEAQLR
jgi:hypothetical protein